MLLAYSAQLVVRLRDGEPDRGLDLGLIGEGRADFARGAVEDLEQGHLAGDRVMGGGCVAQELVDQEAVDRAGLGGLRERLLLSRLGFPPVPCDPGEPDHDGQDQAGRQTSQAWACAGTTATSAPTGLPGGAAIGRPSRYRRRSSANCHAVS